MATVFCGVCNEELCALRFEDNLKENIRNSNHKCSGFRANKLLKVEKIGTQPLPSKDKVGLEKWF